jgi:hypothetical protein
MRGGPPRPVRTGCRRGPRGGRRVPRSTPAGMSTVRVRRSVRRPSPRHASHGLSTDCPVPWHRPQGTAVITWPRIDWRTRRSSPAPPQSGQRTGLVPGRAPDPSQTVQCTGVSTSTSRCTPKTASLKVRRSTSSASGPGAGPVRWVRPPAVPPIPPKNASNRSPSPPAKGSPGAPPAPGPNTPSAPNRSYRARRSGSRRTS